MRFLITVTRHGELHIYACVMTASRDDRRKRERAIFCLPVHPHENIDATVEYVHMRYLYTYVWIATARGTEISLESTKEEQKKRGKRRRRRRRASLERARE